jgi:hypothetical protein
VADSVKARESKSDLETIDFCEIDLVFGQAIILSPSPLALGFEGSA